MNLTRTDLFKKFYSMRIYSFHKKRSFKQEVVADKTLSEMLSIDCSHWKKAPLSYLSPRESLAMGISVFITESFKGGGYLDKAITLCENAYMKGKNKEIIYLGALALGVLYFEKAILLESGKSFTNAKEKAFQSSAAYLSIASEMAPTDDHSLLYKVVVLRTRGKSLELITKILVKASKRSDHPKYIFILLSEIYKKLGMKEVESFYHGKVLSDASYTPHV